MRCIKGEKDEENSNSKKKKGKLEAVAYEETDKNVIYKNTDLGVIESGLSFIIKGLVLINCERFSINLSLDNGDIALHLNPRLPQNYIVRNVFIKKIWGFEEVTSILPFNLFRGTKFMIQIVITEKEFLISTNGRHYSSFLHRLPYEHIKCLEVKGDVDNVTVNISKVNNYPEYLENTKPKRISKVNNIDSFNLKKHVINFLTSDEPCLPLPFYGTLPERLIDGKRLTLEGRVKILPHSFFLNLQAGANIWPHPTIAFHLNPRFANVGGSHVICRNSWIDGCWSKEERTELQTDFAAGRIFSLTISCTATTYEVSLNGKFISDYTYRVNPKIVDTLYVQGDIKLWNVFIEDVDQNLLKS